MHFNNVLMTQIKLQLPAQLLRAGLRQVDELRRIVQQVQNQRVDPRQRGSGVFRVISPSRPEHEHSVNLSSCSSNVAVLHFFYERSQFTKHTKSEIYGFTEFLCKRVYCVYI